MRTQSNAVRAASNAQNSSAQWFLLIQISHTYSGVTSPLYLTNNPDGASYDGDTYTYFPFTLDLPDSKDEQASHGRITIAATDQQLTAIIRSQSAPATMSVIGVCWPVSGSIEPVASYDFIIRNVVGKVDAITGDLIYEEALDNQIPCDEGSPFTFPGVA